MPPTIQDTVKNSPAFSLRDNLFYQNDFQGFRQFEQAYIEVRSKEQRMYSDELVAVLPWLDRGHPLWKEWTLRAFTMRRLLSYLERRNARKILEIGCGNGWLCHRLADLPNVEVAGIDVNETELLQGSRVFANAKNLTFIYGDIFRVPPLTPFDHIILSASLQYFPDALHLLRGLMHHLSDRGEIHIIDTPLYSPSSASGAADRSGEYFARHGVPEMTRHYHHHTFETIAGLNPTVHYDPEAVLNKLRRKFFFASPFPWIIIHSTRIS
ncbi:MAG TPA: class I SAM-dependent methyltransferase [Chryseosolibacter sp.]|nr:class I SAM-dependent methyltransferase [Chryseosolibacter sp.]